MKHRLHDAEAKETTTAEFILVKLTSKINEIAEKID